MSHRWAEFLFLILAEKANEKFRPPFVKGGTKTSDCQKTS